MGTPTLYRPQYCQEVLDDMDEGYSLGAFAGKIGVTRPTICNWMHQFPEFKAAVEEGKARRLRIWEANASKFAFGKQGGNAAVLMFGLRNAGADDWKDVKELEISGKPGKPLQTVNVTASNAIDAAKIYQRMLSGAEDIEGSGEEP